MRFFHTHVSARAVELATETLRSGFLSEGERVKEFESELRRRLGLVNPVALNSGTSALHLALALAGVRPGDEVILPAQTFVASGLAILMCGGKPIFSDIECETGNIDANSVRAMVTSRTKAVMPVHWGGYPCDLEEINRTAHEHKLAVVEDAAHALGATYKGRPIGAISRFTAFSFQAIKHLTTGDGGALCCLDSGDAHRAQANRWFGIDRASSPPSILGEREYNISELGYKYHLNDVGAAIGLGNLDDLPFILHRRRQIAATYLAELIGVAGLTLLRQSPDRESSWWLFTVLVERREDFIRKLASCGVPASVVHLRIDRNSVFGDALNNLPNQEVFDAKQVAIPVHSGLSDEDVAVVLAAIKNGW